MLSALSISSFRNVSLAHFTYCCTKCGLETKDGGVGDSDNDNVLAESKSLVVEFNSLEMTVLASIMLDICITFVVRCVIFHAEMIGDVVDTQVMELQMRELDSDSHEYWRLHNKWNDLRDYQ